MDCFPRTMEGGFQHKTSDSLNEQELWDDTLYMTVLFLANMGRILKDARMVQEAQYQFLLHEKYLCDRVSGLWYHGWTFRERNQFAGAFWGRGNCWITMAIPEFLAIVPEDGPVRRLLIQSLQRQVESLVRYQSENGMWHTLVDDADSYVEASATCGFAYGILKAVKDGLIDPAYRLILKNRIHYGAAELYDMLCRHRQEVIRKYLFRLLLCEPSWELLPYLLTMYTEWELSDEEKRGVECGIGGRFAYAVVSKEQEQRILAVLEKAGEKIPEAMRKGILFDLSHVVKR